MVRLQCGQSSVTVFPAIGAGIGQWLWDGTPLLFGAAGGDSIGAMACFPMVPYANRIAHGKLSAEVALPPHPGEAHSLHGVGWRRAWDVVEQTADRVVLSLQHDGDRDWPFAFASQLTVEVGDDWLRQTLTVTNRSALVMPAGLGLHPYFPVTGGTTLATAWEGLWEVSADHLPIGWRAQQAPQPVAVEAWVVNNCFTQWTGRATLAYRDHSLAISADPTARFVQCYRPETGSAFVAIEPVTHVPNAHQLRTAGDVDSGLRDLPPGAQMATSMLLQASR